VLISLHCNKMLPADLVVVLMTAALNKLLV